LTDVLAKVDLPTGEKSHSTTASYYLLVEARDGYRAVFAWAEVDATFMDKAVYVVTRRKESRALRVGGAGREAGRALGSTVDGVENQTGQLRRGD
jgi:hypothetical protein